MSLRYPDRVQCPECGLTVLGNRVTGEIHVHVGKAIKAGFYMASCADASNVAQQLRARDYRQAAAARRREYWRSRDPALTITDEGTAQRR